MKYYQLLLLSLLNQKKNLLTKSQEQTLNVKNAITHGILNLMIVKNIYVIHVDGILRNKNMISMHLIRGKKRWV